MRVTELPQSAIEFIGSPDLHAHLVTLNEDGWPQVSIVWSAVVDGEICVASLVERRNIKNVRRDPRVVLSYFSPQKDDDNRLHYYLVVRGRARITEGGAPEFLRRVAPRFITPGVKYPRTDNPPEGFITRIKPEIIQGYGPWMTDATSEDFYSRLKLNPTQNSEAPQ